MRQSSLLVLTGIIGISLIVWFFAVRNPFPEPSDEAGSPSASMPSPSSGAVSSAGIRITTPAAGGEVVSPLRIEGEVSGDGWVAFEGQAGTVELLDAQGVKLGFALLKTTADWMQSEVPFEAMVVFDAPKKSQSGTLVFRNENPSGQPEREREFRLSVTLVPSGDQAVFVPPLDRAEERVTKKPFGILIDRATSPVQPERFSGYHIGTDFEVFPEELDRDVVVRVVCDGPLVLKKRAEGYGGVAVQRCELDGKPITVVYGHLKLTSIDAESGEALKRGDRLGLLGADQSVETDGERKHLHLGIHRGAATDIRGYVSASGALADWLDACRYGACGD